MDLSRIETALRETAGVVVADPRALRRIIKHHRDVAGLVPHVRCYAIDRDALREAVVDEDELGELRLGTLPTDVVLVARPPARDLAGRSERDVLARFWRAAFHARVHRALEHRVAEGGLDDRTLRGRVDAIGQTEFDEIRAILRHDDLVMPPGDDREVYIEFAALYLEQRYFAPGLLVTTFPGLDDHERVMATISLDIDVRPLLERDRPAGIDVLSTQLDATSMPSFSAPAFPLGDKPAPRVVTAAAHARLLRRAERAREERDDVRAALCCLRASGVDDADLQKKAESEARAAIGRLSKRLDRALASEGDPAPQWSSLLYILADRAAAERAMSQTVEARVLFMLQRAAVAHERTLRTVDVVTAALSLGRRPVVRELPATRELRVAREIAAANRKVRNVRLAPADRKLLAKLLSSAVDQAERKVRMALKPRLDRAFEQVGLVPRSGAERLARDKVAEELIDRALLRGFLSFDALRDAISRNQLKLDDLTGLRELREGDPLLKADAALSEHLDGVYRRGDIYLRGLQKVSSLPFGTRIGRALTLFFILPLGASFVILEGVTHIVSPMLGWVGLPGIEALNTTSFVVCALVILALLHSPSFRTFAMEVLELVGVILAWIFLRGPRWLFTAPLLRRVLQRPAVRFTIRRIAIPAAIGAVVYLVHPMHRFGWWMPLAVALGVFFVSSLVMSSRLGAFAEEFVVDQLAPTWQVVSRQWLPGLLRLIGRFFRAMMDLLERGIYRIDELLRFRDQPSLPTLVFKGAAVVVWGAVAYVVRLYVTLLIEPEINPLKHFPVVTVAHKLMLRFYAELLAAFYTPLSPLGEVVAGTIAGVTVFLLPSVFGFLAWELKENYKLYRATRPERLPPAPVGPHGETMRGLLVVGVHSGTLPKLYERLRRAAQREDEASMAPIGKKSDAALGGLSRFREGIADVERSVRRFVERELLTLLHRCPRWVFGRIRIERVDLSSNRIRVQLSCRDLSPNLCELTIEEQSGYVVAGMPHAGFVTEIQGSAVGVRLFENALAGFYQRAEIDLVREQLEAELPEGANYDIADEGLVVWPDDDYGSELVYSLEDMADRTVAPTIRGADPKVPPRVLDARRMFYREQSISWLGWVSSWTTAAHEDAAIPRLLRGVSVLPARDAHPLRRGQTRYERTLRTSTPPPPVVAEVIPPVRMPTIGYRDVDHDRTQPFDMDRAERDDERAPLLAATTPAPVDDDRRNSQ
jgi:hypothetical protein